MRQITTREKIFLSIGIVSALAIFVYFIFWPMLQGDQSGSASSLEELQGRLESIKKLEDISPALIDLEKQMREQSGYGEMSFKRGIAGSAIFSYLAKAASQAGIKDLEQLDPKPYAGKKSENATASDQAVLTSIVDRIYLGQVMDEMEQESKPTDAAYAENSPSDVFPESEENIDPDNPEISETGNPADPAMPENSGSDSSDENIERTETRKLIFPPIPRDIPYEVKQSLVKFAQVHPGKTMLLPDINWIMDDAGVDEEKESERIRKRLKLYSDRVTEVKSELRQWLRNLGILESVKAGHKADKFTVKMVFKSQMDQLVKLLYSLQESAKWLKVESMRVSISDRKETLLSVELTMTATALYDL